MYVCVCEEFKCLQYCGPTVKSLSLLSDWFHENNYMDCEYIMSTNMMDG